MKGIRVYTHGMKNKNYTERTLIKHSKEWNDRALAVAIHYGVGKSEAIRLGVDQLYEALANDAEWKARLQRVAQFYGVTESELIRSLVDVKFDHLEFVGWKHTDPSKNG